MAPLQPEEKEKIRNYLNEHVGRSFKDGLHAQILREVDFRDYEDEHSSGTVTTVILEGHRLKVSDLHSIEGFKVLSVEQLNDTSDYRDVFEVQVRTLSLQKVAGDQ